MSENRGPRPSLMIGFDFGTTYSSAIHTLVQRCNALAALKTGQFDTSRITEVLFDGTSHVKSELAWHPKHKQWIWGNEVETRIRSRQILESDCFRFLKLGLDGSKHTGDIRTKLAEQIHRLPQECNVKCVDDLITIYLQRLFTYAKDKIRYCYERLEGRDIFDVVDVECVVCVPAMWRYRMNLRMKAAAYRAGIPHPEIVSEPEAAAMFIRYDEPRRLSQLSSSFGRSNAPFLVLDVGGGTADIVTYILKGGSMREGVKGVGGLYGSSMLNNHFQAFFAHRLAFLMDALVEDWVENWVAPDNERAKQDILALAIKGFEEAKKSFDGFSSNEMDQAVVIELPGIRRYDFDTGIRPGYMEIPSYEISTLFLDVMQPILTMIKEQIIAFNDTYRDRRLKIERIFFVGGASGSKHIRTYLERNLASQQKSIVGYPIELTTPHENSATLIAKGSILKALHRHAIRETVMRCSIGFAWNEEYQRGVHKEHYDPAIHGRRKVVMDYHDGAKVVSDRVHWLFRINETLLPGTTRSMTGFIGAPVKGPITIKEYIYESETEIRDHLPVKDPNNDITNLGYVEFILSEEDRKDFYQPEEGTAYNSEPWQKIDYMMRIIYMHTEMLIEMLIPRRGQAKDSSDWANNPITKQVRLNLEEVIDTTKQRSTRETSRRDKVDQVKAATVNNGGTRRSKRLLASVATSSHVDQIPYAEQREQREQLIQQVSHDILFDASHREPPQTRASGPETESTSVYQELDPHVQADDLSPSSGLPQGSRGTHNESPKSDNTSRKSQSNVLAAGVQKKQYAKRSRQIQKGKSESTKSFQDYATQAYELAENLSKRDRSSIHTFERVHNSPGKQGVASIDGFTGDDKRMKTDLDANRSMLSDNTTTL